MEYNHLKTEQRNPKSTHIDKMGTFDMLKLMNDENKLVPLAVEAVLPEITALVDKIVPHMCEGGRIIYVGAGTSGRMAVADAAECPPTFGVDNDVVMALVAGGADAVYKATEDSEDDGSLGVSDIEKLCLTPRDTVIGISASGSAQYVIQALCYAKTQGCMTACITCSGASDLAKVSDLSIVPDTGPEVLTGSTRLKAGTAQKMILNMISTSVMIQTGKVYENMMVHMKPTNQKLRDRAIRIIMDLTGADPETASTAFDKAEGEIVPAVESIRQSYC